jgi:hypothetical protein
MRIQSHTACIAPQKDDERTLMAGQDEGANTKRAYAEILSLSIVLTGMMHRYPTCLARRATRTFRN